MENVKFITHTEKEYGGFYLHITAVRHGAVIGEHYSKPFGWEATVDDMNRMTDKGIESLKKFILKNNLV